MRNEKGMTLVELLVSVVIVGLIIVPLFVLMTGSFSRAAEQGKDTQLSYYGQEIMEKLRVEGFESGVSATTYYCLRDKGCVSDGDPTYNPSTTYDAISTLNASIVMHNMIKFYEIEVEVVSTSDAKDSLQIVTVVRQ